MMLQIGQHVVLLDGLTEGVVISSTIDSVVIRDETGLEYKFHPKEVVVKNKDQFQFSKFSDINNKLLKQKQRSSVKKSSVFKKSKKEIIMKVDLHIEKLVKSTRGMNSTEIINKQLDYAENQLKFALNKKIHKIIFIHGVGEGFLKSELKRIIENYRLTYYAASYKKFGMGATEVSLSG